MKIQYLPVRIACCLVMVFILLGMIVVPSKPVAAREVQSEDPPWGYQKVTASDVTNEDNFGNSVAIEGDTALVGMYHDNGKQGAVYVFTRSNGVWNQQQKLIASDGASGDIFGYRVVLDGDTALVSAYWKHSKQGAVYVFVRENDGNWTEQQKLTASDGAGYDYFGRGIALDGDTAIVGAYGDDDRGSHSGSAYIFTRSSGIWTQQDKLIAMDGVKNDSFGVSVSVEGDIALVGAYKDNTLRGSVYVFTRSGTNWSQQQKLTASDSAASDQFGISLAMDGDTVLIGAHGDDGYSGSAYIFTRSSGIWSQQQKMIAPNRVSFECFGEFLTLQGNTALVGAYGDESNRGEVYRYTRDNGKWILEDRFIAPDGEDSDNFGKAVALDGETVLVGAPFDDDQASNSGAAYFLHSSSAASVADNADVVLGNGPVTVDVLANDLPTTGYVWDEDTFTFTQPAHGTATKGSIIYTPDLDFIGEDSLTYHVCDTFHICVDGTVAFNIQAASSVATEAEQLPSTGFTPGVFTKLPAQPEEKKYTSTAMTFAIPVLGVQSAIVSVPQSEKSWDVTWLGDSVGYLNGTAFPTWAGNTVLTGHVWDASNHPGIFADLKTLQYGDRITIEAWGKTYTYEVRESRRVSAGSVNSVLKHEELDWITLVTCEDYQSLWQEYDARRVVRAVLVNVK